MTFHLEDGNNQDIGRTGLDTGISPAKLFAYTIERPSVPVPKVRAVEVLQFPLVTDQGSNFAPGNRNNGTNLMKPNPSWNGFRANEEIENQASPRQKWDRSSQPIPPICQILLRDSHNDPKVMAAIEAALHDQAGGDKLTRIGDLIVLEYAKHGGDGAAVRQKVETAFKEQRAMELDFATRELAGMTGGNKQSAAEGAKIAEQLAQQSPFKMMKIIHRAEALWLSRNHSEPGALEQTFRDAGMADLPAKPALVGHVPRDGDIEVKPPTPPNDGDAAVIGLIRRQEKTDLATAKSVEDSLKILREYWKLILPGNVHLK